MTDIKDSFNERLQDTAVRLAFEQDWLHQEFVTQLEMHMDKAGLSRTKLAQRMGKSPAFVSRAMRSGQNLTIHTMVHMAQAADLRICLTLAPVAELPMPKSKARRIPRPRPVVG